MNPTTSKLESNVANNLICGFNSNDNLTFNKTITCLNQAYTVTITFKSGDSDLQKKTFLNNYSNEVENTVKIAIDLGLGSVKGPSVKKSERNFTITTLKFH
jgi:hypothetical protein